MSCISVSNNYIAVGGRDGLLTVYDIKSYNKLLRSIKISNKGSITCMDFVPNIHHMGIKDKFLVVGDSQGQLKHADLSQDLREYDQYYDAGSPVVSVAIGGEIDIVMVVCTFTHVCVYKVTEWIENRRR